MARFAFAAFVSCETDATPDFPVQQHFLIKKPMRGVIFLQYVHASYANEASPQQAAGYQEENLIMMRNHGFSNSSL